MTERILILNLGKKDSGIETRRPYNKRLIGLSQHIFQRFLCGLVRLRKMVQTVECSGNHNAQLKFLAETVEQCCVVIASQEKQKLLLIEKRMACIKQVSQLCFEGVLTKVQIPVQSQIHDCQPMRMILCQIGRSGLELKNGFARKFPLKQPNQNLFRGAGQNPVAAGFGQKLFCQNRLQHLQITFRHLG